MSYAEAIMSRLLMSNSEVLAICRNRSEQRNLSGKLDQLDHVAFQSKDAIQQDLKTWRKFRRENVKNSGWSPKSIRPEPGEDVFFPASCSGRSAGGSPNSPTQGKDASFTKPWAYSYSPSSHNRVYKELTQVSNNNKKALDLNLKSLSVESATDDENPALLRHVRTVQTLNRAACALSPPESKLLSMRQNEASNGISSFDQAAASSLESGAIKMKRAAKKVSTVQTMNKITTCTSNKTSSASENASNKFVTSVNAMKGLTKSKDIFKCFKCGRNVENSKKLDHLPDVALVYKGLHRAQTVLKLLTQQSDPEPDNPVSNEEVPKRRCCQRCMSKDYTTDKESKSFKEISVNKSKNNNSNIGNLRSSDRSYRGKMQRRLSSVSNLSQEQLRRLKVAKEKVSKCFELPGAGEMGSNLNTEVNDSLSSATSTKLHGDDAMSLDVLTNKEETSGKANSFTQEANSEKILLGKKGIAQCGTRSKKTSLHNLSEERQGLGIDKDKLPTEESEFRISEIESNGEYPSDISQQQVMKVIQEEVIDKLNKLANKQKSPPRMRKFSTLSRASTVFKLGVNRKKKAHKTNGVDIFTRIAKYMLFEVWKRRKERLNEKQKEEINNSSKKISQMNFRATYLSLTQKPCPHEDNIDCNTTAESEEHSGKVKEGLDGYQFHSLNSKRAQFSDGMPHASNAHQQQRDNQMYDNDINTTKQGDQNQNDLSSNQTSQNNNPQRQFWLNTKNRISQEKTQTLNTNGNTNSCEFPSPDAGNNLSNDNDKYGTNVQFGTESFSKTNTPNDPPASSNTNAITTLPLPNKKRQKPVWMKSNGDTSPLSLKPEVYHKGIKLSNYVCPEKRYLTVKREKEKKDLSVRWHSSVGAMVNKHEISQEPMIAEKTFPKQARHRALHKMIEANHMPAPDDASKIHNEMLLSRIQDFLHSVEPYRRK